MIVGRVCVRRGEPSGGARRRRRCCWVLSGVGWGCTSLIIYSITPTKGKSILSMRIVNSTSGDVVEIDSSPGARSLYRFKRVCKGLDRLTSLFGLQVYFLTLTLSDENLNTVNSDLNKFLDWLRVRFKRADAKFYYVWAVELQKRRYRKYGKAALHWHFAIVCRRGALPDVEFRQNARIKYHIKADGDVVTAADLFERWGRGQVFCMMAYSQKVYGYLSKYFTKEYEKLDGYNPEWAKLRRFGSSQLGKFAYPQWAFDGVEEKIEDCPELAEMYLRRVGSKVGFFAKESYLSLSGRVRSRFVPVQEIRSPWRVLPELQPPNRT